MSEHTNAAQLTVMASAVFSLIDTENPADFLLMRTGVDVKSSQVAGKLDDTSSSVMLS